MSCDGRVNARCDVRAYAAAHSRPWAVRPRTGRREASSFHGWGLPAMIGAEPRTRPGAGARFGAD
ncbi:hypothetical protein ACWGH7_25815, partial [Streptomyces cyaneofuscatus]